MDIWFIIAYDSIIQKARMTTRISKTSIFKCKNKNNNKRNHSSNIRQHWWKMHTYTYHNKLCIKLLHNWQRITEKKYLKKVTLTNCSSRPLVWLSFLKEDINCWGFFCNSWCVGWHSIKKRQWQWLFYLDHLYIFYM